MFTLHSKTLFAHNSVHNRGGAAVVGEWHVFA